MIIDGPTSETDLHIRMAADWFAALQVGRGDVTAFEAWRAQDPRHALAFARVSATWGKLQDTEPVSIAGSDALQQSTPNRRALLRGIGLIGIGLVAGIGSIDNPAAAWSTSSTDVGETKRVRLPDGSYVGLNTDTAIAWRNTPTKRMLRLDRGEITLTIAQGPPMTLLCGIAHSALGTGLYNVRTEDGGVRLLVLRGKAQMTEIAGSKTARHGYDESVALNSQALVVRDEQFSIDPVSSREMATTLAWQQGEIVFDDIPLSSAIAEYNRYLRRKLILDEPGLGSQRVGGRFLTSDVAPFLAALQASLDIEVTSETDRLLLYRRKNST